MEEKTKQRIEEAINSPEFISRLAKGFDLLPCIKKILEFEDIIPLESLRKILDKRIADLNIASWFIRIETVENNILKLLHKGLGDKK